MLGGADGERERKHEEAAPVSTLVLNCFIDVIGQQVRFAEWCSGSTLNP